MNTKPNIPPKISTEVSSPRSESQANNPAAKIKIAKQHNNKSSLLPNFPIKKIFKICISYLFVFYFR